VVETEQTQFVSRAASGISVLWRQLHPHLKRTHIDRRYLKHYPAVAHSIINAEYSLLRGGLRIFRSSEYIQVADIEIPLFYFHKSLF